MSKLSFFIVEFIICISILLIPFNNHQALNTSELLNYVIIIDPGHGGKDNGCVVNNICEDRINLEISLVLYEELINEGFIVYLTRDGDYDLAYEDSLNRKRDDLKNRIKLINSYQASLLVSIHMNYYDSPSIYGPMVYYKDGDDSCLIAENIQKELNLLTSLNKITHSEDFYLFRNTYALAILIECGFLSNKIEQEKLIDNHYQRLLCKCVSKGIKDYFINNKNNG